MIILYSSNKKGVAFVETKNLDGETNLKYKEVPKKFLKSMIERKGSKVSENVNTSLANSHLSDEKANITSKLSSIYGTVTCDFPNPHMYEFNGVMNIQSNQLNEELLNTQNTSAFSFSLEYNNLLLRGSSLKNTDYIYGLIVNAGHNTKIMLNSSQARSKQSKVSQMMNSQLYIVIIIELIICFSLSLLFSISHHPFVRILNLLNLLSILFLTDLNQL